MARPPNMKKTGSKNLRTDAVTIDLMDIIEKEFA